MVFECTPSSYIMKSTLRHFGVLGLIVVAAVIVGGCEEALTGVENTAGVPSIEGDDTPFVEIQTGTEGQSLPAPVSIEVQPNVTIEDVVNVEYEVSGDAVEGDDYVVGSPNPISIEHDPNSTSLESADIEIGLGDNVTEATTATVTLTNVSTEQGSEVQLGRGGTDIGTSRTVVIQPPEE